MRACSNLITLLVLVAAAGPAAGAGGLKEAEELLRTGKYAEAEAAFGKLTRSAQGGRAALGQARVQLETGRYAEAIKTAGAVARGQHKADALTLIGEAQRLSGKLPAAEKTLREVVTSQPRHYRARAFLGLVYHEQGKVAEARQTFDLFYDDFGADKIDKSSAEQLTYVAAACRYTDNFRDASDTYQDAVKADPKHVEAWVQWAEISLEKYEAGHAEQHYLKALSVNPNLVPALVGLAEVKLEQSNDVEGAGKLLDLAEKVSPGSLEAKAVRAQMLIDAEEYSRAEELLAKALQQNGNHLRALSLLAASRFLRDDLKGFQEIKQRVLKINPRFTRFFREVVTLAVRQHRYAESIDLSKEAIRIDPRDWYSLADLGQNYLRLGDDQQGLKHLRQAWKGDAFNVRNFNLLNLYEDVLAKEYTFVTSPHFKLRVHKEERALLQRIVVPLLERAYAGYVKRYRFTPQGPIIVELFRDPDHYAVRTVGLPGLSALGVCFGRVITSISPLAGRFNWGQVLWHELNHVFTIQMTRSRIPRWLTEGLADLEPTRERPEWKRENDFDISRALRAGRLRGFGGMNTAFTQAKSIEDMVVAYYQGHLMVSFLIANWGFDKLVAALPSYARSRRSEEILPALTRLSLAELDRRFRDHELKRLAHYNRSWYLDLQSYEDLAARQKAAAARPADAVAQAELAAALLAAGKGKEAEAQAEKALALDARSRIALWVAARAARARQDTSRATGLLQRLVVAGGDGFDARMELGSLALARNDLREAAAHLGAAKRLDPERGAPYLLLARAYEKAGQTDALLGELKGLAQLEQQSIGPVSKLVELLWQRKDWAALRHYGMMGYYIDPASVKIHRALAAALAAPAPRPDLDRAVWHLETALLSRPRSPLELHLELGKLHLRRKDTRQAREQLSRVLEIDPNHAEARMLRRGL
jgi:tetratricopeptide (TPR) repeat protein